MISILAVAELRLSLRALFSLRSSDNRTVTFMKKKNIYIYKTKKKNKGTTTPLQSRSVATTNNAVSSGARVHRGHRAP